MPPVSIEGILIGMGITLLGVIVGGYVGYQFSRKVTEEQIRKMAGAKLRAAFAPDLAYFFLLGRDLTDGDMGDALITRQAPAVEEYRVFVPPESQGRYQKAWEHYYEPFRTQNLAIYKNKKEIYRERIEAILKFTELN